jgi:heat shock protein HtpX
MGRPLVRLLMAVVGLVVLSGYAAAAYLSYALLRLLLSGGPSPAVLVAYVLLLGAVIGYVSYRAGTRQLLAELDARPLSRAQSPRLYRRLDDLAARMGVETPDVMLARLSTPNAFAIGGPTSGRIVVDERLFRLLSARELEAILAHELAHLASYDGLVKTLAYSLLRTVAGMLMLALLPLTLLIRGLASGFAWFRGRPAGWAETTPGRLHRGVELFVATGLFALTLPLLAYSRRREYAADGRAVDVTGHPAALARALRKIERASQSPWDLLSTLYLSGDDEGPLTRMLSTHPATDDRIKRLRERARVPASRR